MWSRPLVLTMLALAAQHAGIEPMTQALPGVWGAQAAYLWPGPTALADSPPAGRAIDVASPDRSSVLSIRNSQLRVKIARDPMKTLGAPIGLDSLAEVSWSPDSGGFAITESDGGWVGSWSVRVFLVGPAAVQAVRVTDSVLTDFQSRPGGCRDEVPNLGAAGWLGPDVLLIVAEAPPHSSCRDMGTIAGYEVSVPTGRILQKFDGTALQACCAALLGSRLTGHKK